MKAARWGRWLLLWVGMLLLGWQQQRVLLPAPDTAWLAARQRGTLRVAVDATLPPFAFLDSNAQYRGFEIELARALAQQLQLGVQFDLVAYDSLYNVLQTERADLSIASLAAIPSRTADFTYLPAYFNAGTVLVIPTQPVAPANFYAWLAHKRLAVELGADANSLARQLQRRVPGLQVAALDSPAAVFTALQTQAVDAGLLSAIQSSQLLAAQPPTNWQLMPVQDVPYHIVIKRSHWQLAQALSAALLQLETQGITPQLRTDWFGWSARQLQWAASAE